MPSSRPPAHGVPRRLGQAVLPRGQLPEECTHGQARPRAEESVPRRMAVWCWHRSPASAPSAVLAPARTWARLRSHRRDCRRAACMCVRTNALRPQPTKQHTQTRRGRGLFSRWLGRAWRRLEAAQRATAEPDRTVATASRNGSVARPLSLSLSLFLSRAARRGHSKGGWAGAQCRGGRAIPGTRRD